ncbi:GAF and ANTAR domain-containing protein [Amycolatopsis jejuensis]|uniref:GAF and ANTAR domain-containing protein n=1 Tax=Amycolatopsis jejuensis TaxID=330084 RepID=UPI001FE0B86A|nr:GAF and ANTAR domain-containing protein [Amycolatopsis jejuensis]
MGIAHSVVVRLTGVPGDPVALQHEIARRLVPVPEVVVFELTGLTTFTVEALDVLRVAQAERVGFACRPGAAARSVLEAAGIPVADSAAAAFADGDDPPQASGTRFRTLTEMLLAAETVGEVLQHVVDTAVSLIPSADLVSITLRAPDGTFHTAAYTDPAAAELDRLQYDLGQGPCHDAAEPGRPEFIECPDLSAATIWPAWAPAAAGLGWGGVLATALAVDSPPRFSGALNLYSRKADGLAEADRDLVLLLASHATLAVAETDAATRDEVHQQQLRRALDSRDVIGQAKGIIMARRGLDADEAFELLRRTSQQLNVKLVHLAGTLAERHGELDVPEALGEADPV